MNKWDFNGAIEICKGTDQNGSDLFWLKNCQAIDSANLPLPNLLAIIYASMDIDIQDDLIDNAVPFAAIVIVKEEVARKQNRKQYWDPALPSKEYDD